MMSGMDYTSYMQRVRSIHFVHVILVGLFCSLFQPPPLLAEEPFPIGLICPLTGPYAIEAQSQKEFALLAAREINAAGGVLGKPIDIRVEDTFLKPGMGIKKAEKLIQGGVRYLTGGLYSSSVTAISRVAHRNGVIHMGLGGSNDLTGKYCNSHHFNMCPAGYQMVAGTGSILIDRLGIPKDWFAITVDYSWGQTTLSSVGEMLETRQGSLVGNAFVAVKEQDFSAALVRAMASGARVLCLIVYGKGQAQLLQQLYDLGIKKKMRVVVIASNLNINAGLAPEVTQDIYVGLPWYWNLDNPVARRVNALYQETYGYPGDWPGAQVYDSIHVLAKAIEKAGSFDTGRVIPELEGMAFETSKTVSKIRACDHRVIQDWYVGIGKPVSRRESRWDIFDILGPVGGEALMLDCEHTGCRMTAAKDE